MSLKDTLSTYWLRIQGELLPWLDDAMDGPLNAHHRQLVSVFGLARIETFLPSWYGLAGRPPAERAALAAQLHRQGCVQPANHPPAARHAIGRQDITPSVSACPNP